MKRTNIYKYAYYLLIPLLLGVSACEDYLDVNDTPNNPLAVTPPVLLPSALAGTAFANANELNRFAAVTVTHLAGAAGSPAAYDIYNIDGGVFGNQWRFEIYGGALVNYQKLIEDGEERGANAYVGIAKIMKAYTFSIATDVWGDVPYSEALKGTEFLQPRIDSQEDIYKGNSALGIQSLFDLVREGLADLEEASTFTPGSDDLVYEGDIEKWKKAGNTLLLKFAMQISRREPALAASVINEVLAKGPESYIASNTEDLNVRFGASVGSQSPIHTYTNVSSFKDELIVSTRFVDVLESLNDPRLPIFVTKPGADYVTVDNGFRGTLPQPVANWSRYNSYVTGVNGEGPVRLVTNFQRAFILAEAALTLPGVATTQTAQEYYTEAITASMELAGLTSAEITAYLDANPAIATLSGSTEQQLEQIMTQKWIAWFGNGLEAWNDWRRTGYPVLAPSQNAVGIDGTRPVRAQYIEQELSRNPNFPNPGPLSNEKLWWDVD
ncbi:SusD/RagB family nutrient-binding outer membrane lipoprotein [Rhodocytophaga aerolata]|uniref:SusD/RagB family nutrient-binding outer membrane lipoprotein n=1 Tax=Rhodocytophaga aerolata TaxID=455078 RepID=A0ABT8R8Y1_9BACT|nr:SusD/RagB family nutrient-binding outer membrane lipoprotein [Rhodocytophaga aerolata]MDO1448546.1 SusD/RagB family nutrient-binding outer membrane lipoprotein [Rhodocytophaga aerolata]